MASVRLPWFVFAAILLGASISWWHAYPELPERVASHFNGAGVPNGWMTKDQFFTLSAFLVALAIFTGLLPPFLISKMNPSLINLPNKEYWLAPGQHDATVAYFRLWFAWFACGLLFFVALVSTGGGGKQPQRVTQAPEWPVHRFAVGISCFYGRMHRRVASSIFEY